MKRGRREHSVQDGDEMMDSPGLSSCFTPAWCRVLRVRLLLSMKVDCSSVAVVKVLFTQISDGLKKKKSENETLKLVWNFETAKCVGTMRHKGLLWASCLFVFFFSCASLMQNSAGKLCSGFLHNPQILWQNNGSRNSNHCARRASSGTLEGNKDNLRSFISSNHVLNTSTSLSLK